MLENIYRSGLYELLQVFYKNKKKSLNFNKIVELSSLGQSSVTRYLKFLVKDKIVNFKKDANLIKYSLNHNNPITISLLINFDKEYFLSLPLNIRKVITEIRRNFDNNYIFIFGSFAKGSYKKSSDLDIFVAIKNKLLIKENDLIKKLQFQYGIKIDLQISILTEINDNQKHIISTGLPISNYDNFYEVYFGL